MSYQKGFTLMELVVTVGIAAIISSFALPSFQSLIEKQKASSIADSLYHHLNFARSEAITKNITTTICASDDGLHCLKKTDWSNCNIVIFTDYNSNGVLDDDEKPIKSLNLGLQKNSLLWRSFGNKPYLQWQPSGMTYFQNGNFTYCPDSKKPEHAKKIILNAAGRIYFGNDLNHDGIQEGSDGKNIQC